ncbi:MAG: phosphatidate cytidylyltransferase [Caulobacteraceae bacterium]|nr:MAG: phosphatidate cytidylyltransferase [Caulobacteraceae bacterium]
MTSSPQAKTFDWKNLRVRLISAFAIIPAVALAVWLGGWTYTVLICLVGALLAREWGRLVAPSAPIRVGLVIGISVIAVIVMAHLSRLAELNQSPNVQWWWLATWGLVVVGSLLTTLVAFRLTAHVPDAAYGVIYIAPAGIGMVWLRDMDMGAAWSVFLFAVTWWTDIMAYIFGNIFKGPKLWPRYSPNKTWSGFFGGLVGAVLTAVVVLAISKAVGEDFIGYPGAMLIGFLTGLATMGGDLWESMLKRRFGVKDTGGLIPGHGGVLDRVDGLMFAVMVVAAARLIQFEFFA